MLQQIKEEARNTIYKEKIFDYLQDTIITTTRRFDFGDINSLIDELIAKVYEEGKNEEGNNQTRKIMEIQPHF